MGGSKIEDNASIKKIKQDMMGVKALRARWPFLKPVMRWAGVDVASVTTALEKVRELEEQSRELFNMADRFNDHFAGRGFIAYDLLNFEVMKNAVATADAGRLEEAEQDLVDYYDDDSLKIHLQSMKQITAFRPRASLAEKAKTDYLEGRYHACVPVVLAITDGMVNDVTADRRGLSAEGRSLEAWDTIAGHSTGLTALLRQLRKSRQTTRTEEISFPYRNGILHGMDLGYDNKVVAAKTWALLFAVREWAVKAQAGETEMPLPEPKQPPLQQVAEFAQFLEKNQQFKDALESWKPRLNLPIVPQNLHFDADTPEFALTQFLDFWIDGNYGKMATLLPSRGTPPILVSPKEVRDSYQYRPLGRYVIKSIEDTAAAATNITTEIHLRQGDAEITEQWVFRMICQFPDGTSAVRGQAGSRWTLYGSWAK